MRYHLAPALIAAAVATQLLGCYNREETGKTFKGEETGLKDALTKLDAVGEAHKAAKQDAEKLNNFVDTAAKRVHNASGRFVKAAKAAGRSGMLDDIAKMEAACEEAQHELKSVQEETKSLTLSEKVAYWKELRVGLKDYLAAEQQIVEKHFGELVKVIKDQQMDIDDRKGKTNELVQKAAKDEASAVEKLRLRQQVFASLNKITLKKWESDTEELLERLQ
jgi:hypothetical protein